MVHHIHGVIEERADVLYSTIHRYFTTDNDHNCWGLDPRVHLCLHLSDDWRIFSGVFGVCRFVDSICWTNNASTCKVYMFDK